MKEQSTSTESASRVCYETMEAHARGRIQSWLQDLLEVEVRQFLGRGKLQRQAEVAPARLGYRNGYGKPRRGGAHRGHDQRAELHNAVLMDPDNLF